MPHQSKKPIKGLMLGCCMLLGACQLLPSKPEVSGVKTSATQHDQSAELVKSPVQQVFGWPFANPVSMQPRGGSTHGVGVTLAATAAPAWEQLQQHRGSTFERDRLAILALQGAYRTSFQFVETAGFTPHYKPAQPYFSWGTEYVHLLEDGGDFISLQHTLVMYFQMPDGSEQGPMIMKHWRQDWHYQDQVIFEYQGNLTWHHHHYASSEVKGLWSQSVYQVDDSPRYQVLGRWQHAPGFSSWQSQSTARPLPRREFSVRDDYNLLQGSHRLTLTPTGWIHEQRNQKINRQPNQQDGYMASETGINRYERISSPELGQPAEQYWRTTGSYWRQVRQVWRELMAKHQRIRLKPTYQNKPQFAYHFSYSEKLAAHAKSLEEQSAYANTTIHHFIASVESNTPSKSTTKN